MTSENGGVDVVVVGGVETWRQTMQLRWLRVAGLDDPPKLQQMWISDRGRTEWHWIPTETVTP